MSSFTCPFCGCSTSISPTNYRTVQKNFDDLPIGSQSFGTPGVKLVIFRCPNEDCKKETVIAEGVNGYMDNHKVYVYPSAVFQHFPEYIPEAIRSDYEEACLIRDCSPKAAATLARRCLQGMIRDYWGISGRNLYEEVSQLQGKIPASQWNAINATRQIGNIGAHMEKDASLIIDISPDEAEKLIRLIEVLLDKWYVARHDEEVLYADITATNSAHQDQRTQ